MAHLVETMAYVDATLWHGLGNRPPHNRPIDDWLDTAALNCSIRESSVLYSATESGFQVRRVEDSKVLYRSDTQAPLSVVSNRYKVVQPREVLEFYRDLVTAGDFELETADVLKGSRKRPPPPGSGP